MGKSKQAYFSLLQSLDENNPNGGNPTIAETLKLESLLATHNKNVIAFTKAMQAIKDRPDKGQLIRAMGATDYPKKPNNSMQ